MLPPGLPPLSACAFLLDLDGTLLDIAPRPDAVVVPPGLPGSLLALRDLCGNALAIVTGRPVSQIEALLPGIAFAVAGEHGAAIRHAPDAPVERAALPALPSHWLPAASGIAVQHPGVLLETKSHGLVLHYRAAPQSGAALHAALLPLLAEAPGAYVLMPAKMAWELRPAGTDKASAVRALMQHPPFRGRTPIFVGDDVTDHDGIAEARALGGIGLFVPEVFDGPAGVRAWIASLIIQETGRVSPG